MSGQAVIFLVLVANQVIATTAFAVTYGFGSDWRASPLGRHLMFYTVASGLIDASWLLMFMFRRAWVTWVLLAAMLLLGMLTWQRVYLVVKTQRSDRRQP